MITRIDHVFPAIGKQNIRLFGQAASLYSWMEENRTIQRLAQIPQLGMANTHFPEFRHTRLDYTYLILLIADILKERSAEFRFNLSTSKKYTIGKTSYRWSGAEVLQSWALLLNMGHMHDTFFAEFILHRHFNKHWSGISHHLSRQWSRSLGKEILNDSDYRFHQLLSLIELEELPKNSTLYKPSAGLIGVYRNSNLPSMGLISPSGTDYLRAVYKTIRQIAYLALDTHYSRCPFGITLPKLMAILPSFIYKILDDDQLLSSQLQSLNYWMNDHYYCSPVCVVTMIDNLSSLDKNYAKSLRSSIAQKTKFLELISNWKKETKSVRPAKDWHHVIRIPVRPPDDLDVDRKLFPTIVQHPQSNPDYRLSIINVAGVEYYLDIFARHTPDPYRVLSLIPQSLLFRSFEYVVETGSYHYQDSRDEVAQYRERWRMVRHHCSDHLFAYVDVIFKLLSPKDTSVQFKPVKSKGLGWLYCTGSTELEKDFSAYMQTDFNDYVANVSTTESKIRETEIRFTRDVVRNHLRRWDSVALYTGAVDVFDPQKSKTKTDIDGLAVLFRGNAVRVLLFQNKTSNSGSISQAKKWFNTKLKPLLPAIKGPGRHKVHAYKGGVAISIDF